jgi:hypothetical protein
MPSAVRLREVYSAEELRALARRSKTVNRSRRFLSLAGIKDGMDRGAAAKIGGILTGKRCVTGPIASTPRGAKLTRAAETFRLTHRNVSVCQ